MKTAELEGTQIVGSVGQMGKAILKRLVLPACKSVERRAVGYIMVNILNDEYVTGKTGRRPCKRFNSMHSRRRWLDGDPRV